MDRIKLKTTDKLLVKQLVNSQDFEHLDGHYNVRKHNIRSTYRNQKGVVISLDGFAGYIVFNPTTYINETNIQQITRGELSQVIELLNDDLGIDTDAFDLTGFDFNYNIRCHHPPNSYLNLFRNLPHYHKQIWSNKEGITYTNKCRSLSIYDKVKQQEKKKVVVPEVYAGQYLMRVELGIDSRLRKPDRLRNLRCISDLADVDNYVQIVHEWSMMYHKIPKQSLYRVDVLNRPAGMNIDDYRMLYYINEHGMCGYLDQLESELEKKQITYSKFKTRKDKAEKIWNRFISTHEPAEDLLCEINQKMEAAVQELSAAI
jgi:hypothetical protein